MFQHTAARRRLVLHMVSIKELSFGFNTQPPEGGWPLNFSGSFLIICFNTQPPEGGWDTPHIFLRHTVCFNTQPPEGGWMFSQ